MLDPVEFTECVREWINFREDFVNRRGNVTQDQIREFTERSNKLGARFLRAIDSQDASWVASVGEIAMQAHTMLVAPDRMN